MKIYLVSALVLLVTMTLVTSATAQNYADDPKQVNPILTGTTIPDAAVKTIEGKTVSIQELVRQQPTVLIFYRGGWCPYCNRHMAELQQSQQQLVDMGYQILAVSPDRPEKLKKSISKHNLDYTLLSDSPMNLSKAFGLAFQVGQSTLDRYAEIGI